MWIPELRTLYVTLILTDLVITLCLYLYGKNFRTYPGYLLWMLSLPVYCCSLVIIMVRTLLPVFVTLVPVTILFLLAFLMRLDGIRRFMGRKPVELRYYSLLIVTSIAVSGFCAMDLSTWQYLDVQVVLDILAGYLSIIILVISVLSSIALLGIPEKETRSIRFALSCIFMAVAVLYLIRAITGFTVLTTSPVLYTDAITVVYFYSLILAEILATGLFVVLNMARYQAELSRSEQQARESEEKYRGVVTWGNDGIVMLREGIIIFMNPRAMALFKGTEEDFYQKPFLSFIHPRDRAMVEELYAQRMAGQAARELYETTAITPGGEVVEIEINARIICLNGTPVDLIFIRDISERRRSEKTLEQAKMKLCHLNEVTFRDIGNDIMSLTGYQQLVREMIEASDDSVVPFLEKEDELIRRITGSLRFAQTYQDLGLKPAKWQEIRHIFLMVYSHADTLKMEHTVTTGDLEIYADPLLEQVFQILIENVFLHGKTATRIMLRHRPETDGSVTIFFEDNGAGIVGVDKESIFLREFPQRRSPGLFLVREILGITGITIRETGEPGCGARFEICVPAEMHRFLCTGKSDSGA